MRRYQTPHALSPETGAVITDAPETVSPYVISARNTLRITPVAPSLRGVSAGQEPRSNPTTRGDTPHSPGQS